MTAPRCRLHLHARNRSMVRQQEEPARILRLLRHAKSSWQDADLDDRDRPLTARGHQAGRLLAGHLAGQAAPDLVLCSSALRTRETFDHIAGAYGATLQAAFEDALYLASARTLLRRIEAV